MAVAISRALELGANAVVVPTAGNAGGAMAAYAAFAGLEAHVYMPRDAPMLNQIEVQLHGAQLILVDGLINEAARLAGAEAVKQGWFDVSTLKEPYRIEGKKTMGFELALHFAEGERMAAAGCGLLSDRRRRGADRDVESLRRDGSVRLDRQPPSPVCIGAIRRLRADCPCFPGGNR